MIDRIPAGYYAAHDPENPGAMTCWRRYDAKGRLKFIPWQRGVRCGPVASVKSADLPSDPAARKQAIEQLMAAQNAWGQKVLAVIAADLDAARKLFASFTTRCSNCGRTLTDAEPKLYALGPDCRKQLIEPGD